MTTLPVRAARAAFAALVLWCMGGAAVRAQDQAPVEASAPVGEGASALAAPPAPAVASSQAASNATVTLVNGSQLRGSVLLYVPGQKIVLEHETQTLVLPWTDVRDVAFDPSPAAAPAPAPQASALPRSPAANPNAVGIEHADYFRAQELVRLESQREQLRASNRRWQVPALGLGLGVVSIFIGAGALVASWNESYDCYDDYCSDGNNASWRAGVALLTIGPVLVLVSTPMLIIRASRASRLKRLERTIQRLGGTLSLAPVASPRYAGLAASARF